MKKPAHRILIDGVDISNHTFNRLIRLTHTDGRGDNADQVIVTLDDSDGALAIPEPKAKLQLFIGWQGEPLVAKGEFIIDEVSHEGTPDRFTFVARAANFTEAFATKRTRSWHKKSVGDIVSTIAESHGFESVISDELAQLSIEQLDQTGESDSNLLTRLAQRLGALSSIKDNRLLFKPKGDTHTASKRLLPLERFDRASGDKHKFNRNNRDSFSGVRAYWHDQALAARQSVLLGSEGKVKELPQSSSEAEAKAAARGQWQQIKTQGKTLQLDIAEPRPTVIAEQPAQVSGYKEVINSVNWVVDKVSNVMSGQGYTQKMELVPRSE